MKKSVSILITLTLCFSLFSITTSAGSSIVSTSDSDYFVSQTLNQNTDIMDEVFGEKAQDRYDKESSAQISISNDKKLRRLPCRITER